MPTSIIITAADSVFTLTPCDYEAVCKAAAGDEPNPGLDHLEWYEAVEVPCLCGTDFYVAYNPASFRMVMLFDGSYAQSVSRFTSQADALDYACVEEDQDLEAIEPYTPASTVVRILDMTCPICRGSVQFIEGLTAWVTIGNDDEPGEPPVIESESTRDDAVYVCRNRHRFVLMGDASSDLYVD